MGKHRGEPVYKYRVTLIESECGWGQDSWTEDFDTYEEAMKRVSSVNSENTSPVAPDYYIIARTNIEKVQL